MSDREHGTQQELNSSGRARRRFLENSALATAAASASMLPTLGRAEASTAEEAPPKGCPEMETPMKEVAGKVAFITGGSSGIGLGIARAFVDAGMKVVIGYRTKSHLDEAMGYFASAHNRVHAINVDVTDRAAMQNAAAETVRVFGKVHVLFNNAG